MPCMYSFCCTNVLVSVVINWKHLGLSLGHPDEPRSPKIFTNNPPKIAEFRPKLLVVLTCQKALTATFNFFLSFTRTSQSGSARSGQIFKFKKKPFPRFLFFRGAGLRPSVCGVHKIQRHQRRRGILIAFASLLAESDSRPRQIPTKRQRERHTGSVITRRQYYRRQEDALLVGSFSCSCSVLLRRHCG